MAKKTKKKVAKKATKKAAKAKAVKKKAAKKTSKKPAPKAVQKVTSVNPYLTFNGNCEEAFNFYKSVFGGKFSYIGRFKDMPPMPGAPELPGDMQQRIMHVSLPISNETVLMGSDSNPMMGDVTTGQNISLSVNAKSKSEADKIFRSLSVGGSITMPIDKTFWSAYFGMLIDKFGIIWMVSFE